MFVLGVLGTASIVNLREEGLSYTRVKFFFEMVLQHRETEESRKGMGSILQSCILSERRFATLINLWKGGEKRSPENEKSPARLILLNQRRLNEDFLSDPLRREGLKRRSPEKERGMSGCPPKTPCGRGLSAFNHL